jgi:glycine amidinotransferase
MHIDTTFVPLCPGRALYSPDFFDPADAPEVLKSWELLPAPPPISTMVQMIDLSSAWLSMNVLMLDEKRVICEASQEPLIEKFREWGFEPIPCPYTNHYVYGGAFHCSTLDVRRRGSLQSYF